MTNACVEGGVMLAPVDAWMQLQTLGASLPQLLLDDGSMIYDLEVVRVVLGKRSVCKGRWRDQLVYTKLFWGPKASKYAMRDAHGIERLMQANILTPPLLYQGEVSHHRAQVLIYQAIEPSQNAEAIYQLSDIKARYALVANLVLLVAQHHKAKLIQTDLYLKNFLVKDQQLFTIDGDGIRHPPTLSRKQSLQHLSVLLSKIDVLELNDWLPQLLVIYTQARGWSNDPAMLYQLRLLVESARDDATTAYADKKVFRNCTDITVTQTFSVYRATARTHVNEWGAFSVSDLDQMIATGQTIKLGNTCTVASVNLGGQIAVIKRYNMKHAAHRLGRMLRKSRAAISWSNAHRLQLLGIQTAAPIALIEDRVAWLRGKAYFVSVYIDAPDALEFFQKTQDKALRANAVKMLVQLFYRLYLLRISHGDMKATNIKLLPHSPVLIDLDSMRQHRKSYFAQKAHVRDLKRFMQNWKHDTSLYNAFIKSFKVVYVDHTPLKSANILSD